MSVLRVTELKTERLEEPLAVDVARPAFGWRMESDARGARQTAYRVVVSAGDAVVWDSGRVPGDRSQEVLLGDGVRLEPETDHRWRVEIEDETGRAATATAGFRTGPDRDDPAGWGGASWIGAERPNLDAASLVVWRLRARFRLDPGSSVAGFVLGAGDFRLRTAVFNEYGLAGDNHVAVLVDARRGALRIERAGYAPGDGDGRVVVELAEGSNVPRLLTPDAVHDEHTIEIVCWSSVLQVLVDGVEVAEGDRTRFAVNPRGDNDVPSFPNLGRIGFAAAAGERFTVIGYEVRTFREPQAVLLGADDLGLFDGAPGVTRTGDGLRVDGGASGVLVHRDPSRDGVPVLRRVLDLERAPSRAILSLTARGVLEVEVNGRRVGDAWFDPGAGEYRRTIEYRAHDVTDLLGDLALRVEKGL
uniref:glycoside hydrolase family 78 protein n=1 Tax=uncultured Amnibacterium sp. TaxID=1631851 RepID=UPI0035CA887D